MIYMILIHPLQTSDNSSCSWLDLALDLLHDLLHFITKYHENQQICILCGLRSDARPWLLCDLQVHNPHRRHPPKITQVLNFMKKREIKIRYLFHDISTSFKDLPKCNNCSLHRTHLHRIQSSPDVAGQSQTGQMPFIEACFIDGLLGLFRWNPNR